MIGMIRPKVLKLLRTGKDRTVGKKKRKSRNKIVQENQRMKPSYWMIVAIAAIVISAGLVIKVMSNTANRVSPRVQAYQPQPIADDSLEKQVQRVTAEFKCACGGCGELPLIICDCDMPKGAVEEKAFIRKMLQEGFSVDRVIQLVDEKYGHKIT
jgi:cytochrome c-type biogenesis protein CcmH/NrfF